MTLRRYVQGYGIGTERKITNVLCQKQDGLVGGSRYIIMVGEVGA
jgi:hypothetical protein